MLHEDAVIQELSRYAYFINILNILGGGHRFSIIALIFRVNVP